MKKIYNSNAIRITLSYLIFGTLWIILSDKLVELFISNGHLITTAQTYKGWAFIIVTSLLLFYLLNKVFHILQNEIEKHKSTIDLLEMSESKFRLIFENSGEAIFLTKQDGSIEVANPEAFKIFDRTPEDMYKIGRNGLVDVNDHKLLPALEERKRTGSFKGELNFVRKDGTIFPGEITSTVFKDLENNERTTLIISDISKRKLAEEALRRSKKEFQTYFNSSSVGLSVTAPDKTWIEVNQRLCEIFGYTKEELIGLTWENLTHPEDLSENLKLFQQAVDGEIDSYELDKRFIRKDGSVVYVTLSAVCQHNDDGSVHHLLSSYNDITERKQVELALQKSEERYRLISNVASDYMFSSSVTDDGLLKLNWVAGAFENITGYTFEEYIAKGGWRAALHPDDLEIDEQDMVNLKNNKQVISELRTIAKNGNIIWVRIYAHPLWDNKVEKLIGIYGAVQDITKRKLAEEELRESEERFRDLVENINEVFYISDAQGKIEYCSPNSLISIGYSLQDVLGKSYLRIVAPIDRRRVVDHYLEETKRGAIDTILEFRVIRKDGTIVWAEQITHIVRDNSGNVTEYRNVARDITRRKQAEETLRKSKQQYDDLVSKIPVGIYILHTVPEGTFVLDYVSPKMAEMFNVSVESLLADSQIVIQSIHPDERDDFVKLNQEGIQLRRPFDWKGRVLTAKGVKWLHLVSSPELQQNGDILWHGLVVDITERKHAEDALRESEHKLRLLLESSEDIILMQDLDGKYLYYNGSEAYGIRAEEVIGKTPYDLHKPKYAEIIIKRIKQIANTGHALFLEDKIEWQHEMIWFSNGMFPVKNKEGKIISILTISRNISERKQMEENLRESEERFHSMFENHNAVMLLIDPDNGKIIDANISASKYYGYSITLLKKMNLNDLNVMLPDELKAELDKATKESRTDSNFPHKLSTGEIRLVEVFTTPINLKGGVVLFSIIHDITKRKQAEQEVSETQDKLRALTARLERVREEERIHLSRELHDHLGQNLTGLKMDIAYLAKKIQTGISIEPKDFLSKTSGMITLIDELIGSVRRISAELRPNVLDYLGLIPAIEWQMEELKKRTDMDCVFKSNVTKVDLGSQINSSIFRIIQEAITNITRHSSATKVIVSLEEENDIIKLEILDNGIGIKEDEISSARSLGILGMKERTFQFNGKLHLENAPQGGTLLTLIIPKPER